MQEKISIFFPLRSGSLRSKQKNTKPFLKDGKSLFQVKMHQLIKLVEDVDEIIISTNDELVVQQSQEFRHEKIKIDWRPDFLCQATTKVVDLINYVPTIVSGDIILWLHATSPFCNDSDYRNALKVFQEHSKDQSIDSLMSVNKIQQFLWDDSLKEVINVDRSINPWPNTQDLQPLYEINHAFYISTRDNYLKYQDRIGKKPYLFVADGEKKIDIDWEDDFLFAQRVAYALKDEYDW